MSAEVERSPDWWEALTEGQPVLLAFVRIDRAGSAQEWAELAKAKARELRRAYTAGVEYIARSFNAAQPLRWQGDGVTLFLADADEPAPVRAFRAAKLLWERIRIDLNLTARIAVHAGLIPWHPDTGQLASPALDLCGHLEAAAPPDSIILTEDVYLVLPEAEKRQCAALGLTRRDGLPAYVFPAAAAAKRDPQKFSESGDLALWEAFRQYARSAEIAKLRYVGLRLVRKEPPCLDIEKVFVPLEVERRERRLALTRSAVQSARGVRRKAAEPSEQPPFSRLDVETGTSVPEPFAEAFRRNRGMVVLGEPGSGKSTLLRWLAVVTAHGPLAIGKGFGVTERLLPIPVSVGRLAEIRKGLGHTASVLDAMSAYFQSRGCGQPDTLTRFLDARLAAGDALVLLDGLDEVGTGERASVCAWLETFANAYPKNRFIVSSRRVGYAGFRLPEGIEVALRPFSDEQVAAYIQAFCHAYRSWETGSGYTPEARADADNLLTALRQIPRLRELARNPFLLSAMALIHRAEGRLPRHRVQFYEIFMRCLCESWGRARRLVPSAAPSHIPYEEEALPIFGELAFRMIEDHPSGRAPRSYVVHVLSDVLRRKQGLRAGEDQEAVNRFLQRAGEEVQVFLERGPDEWGFLHLTFQEFFVAAWLLAEERFETVALQSLFDPRWEEVIRLGVGYIALIQKRPRYASEFIRKVLNARCAARPWVTKDLQYQVGLAALLAAEAGDTLDAKLQRTIAERCAKRCLRFIGSSLTSRILRDISLTDFRDVLAQPFVAALEDRRADVRAEAAHALLFLQAQAAIPKLLISLKDKILRVRILAALALAPLKLKRESGVPALLAELKEKDSSVRASAAFALGELKAENAIPSLLAALKDEDALVRWCAVMALGDLKAQCAAPSLLGLLEAEEEVEIGDAAADALREMNVDVPGGEPIPVPLDDKVSEALNTDDPVPALLAVLKDEDSWERARAADALTRFLAPTV